MKQLSFVLALVVCAVITTAAFADAVPQLVNYQGKVYQPSGAAVPDGAYKIAFSIYDVPTGGTALWTETYDALQVKGSAFHVLLGSINPIGASIFSSAERFLGVKLASDPELSPRQKIASVPYAMVAEKAATATVAASAAEATHAASADVAQTVAVGAVTGASIAPQEAWQYPQLLNGWRSYGAPVEWVEARYMKDSMGFVHVEGMVSGGPIGDSTFFTLPSGYRPDKLLSFPGVDAGGGAFIGIVEPDGDVSCNSIDNTFWAVINVCFKAAN